MQAIMIKCPRTQQPFKIGQTVDKQTFESVNISVTSVRCPNCGQVHTLDKKDAYLEPESSE
jgi:uncharacterized protein (UPF0212 family)